MNEDETMAGNVREASTVHDSGEVPKETRLSPSSSTALFAHVPAWLFLNAGMTWSIIVMLVVYSVAQEVAIVRVSERQQAFHERLSGLEGSLGAPQRSSVRNRGPDETVIHFASSDQCGRGMLQSARTAPVLLNSILGTRIGEDKIDDPLLLIRPFPGESSFDTHLPSFSPGCDDPLPDQSALSATTQAKPKVVGLQEKQP